MFYENQLFQPIFLDYNQLEYAIFLFENQNHVKHYFPPIKEIAMNTKNLQTISRITLES